MKTTQQLKRTKNKTAEISRLTELTFYEREAQKNGFNVIAGIDEAGRGPLAGPVVAAACIIPEGLFFEGINDSKKLTPIERARLFEEITNHPQISYGIGIVDNTIIDEINIYQATIRAMQISVQALKYVPDHLLIDGLKVPGFSIPQTAIIKGDSKSQSIAAASIIAKETRDAIMTEKHNIWPQYEFDRHKGYGTFIHLQAIKKFGPCPLHRFSFEPMKSMLLSN